MIVLRSELWLRLIPLESVLNALQTRLLYSNFEKVPTVTSDKMCPLRDFAPPKLKVFRRACVFV